MAAAPVLKNAAGEDVVGMAAHPGVLRLSPAGGRGGTPFDDLAELVRLGHDPRRAFPRVKVTVSRRRRRMLGRQGFAGRSCVATSLLPAEGLQCVPSAPVAVSAHPSTRILSPRKHRDQTAHILETSREAVLQAEGDDAVMASMSVKYTFGG